MAELGYKQAYLIPVFFDFNASTFREANGAPQPLGNNGQVILLSMGNKGFHNECGHRALATPNLHLQKKQRALQSKHGLSSNTRCIASTSFPRRSLTKAATWKRSRFKPTRPLLPRFPNSISGLTTSFPELSQGSLLTSSFKSVASVIYKHSQKHTTIHQMNPKTRRITDKKS